MLIGASLKFTIFGQRRCHEILKVIITPEGKLVDFRENFTGNVRLDKLQLNCGSHRIWIPDMDGSGRVGLAVFQGPCHLQQQSWAPACKKS